MSGLPPAIEEHRDHHWRRDVTRIVQTVIEAERFIEQVGFAASMTDARRPGPSLYVAVCGRRDAVMPRNVQTDPEASLTWTLKDQIVRRSQVYYAKFARGKTLFVAPRMIPFFHALWGLRRAEEPTRLSRPAQAVLRVLRREWEMATADLRNESGVTDRKVFSKAMDELQAAMIVVPSEVIYQPKFTYIWTLGVGRFPDALRRRVKRAGGVHRDRPLLPGGRRHDDSRRAGARHGPVAARCRARQPRARGRGLRAHAFGGHVSPGSRPIMETSDHETTTS